MCKDRNFGGNCRPLVDDDADDEDYDPEPYTEDNPSDRDSVLEDDSDYDDVVYTVAEEGEEAPLTAADLAGIRQRATMVTLAKKAIDIVTGARNKCYGNPYDNHSTSAALWNAYLERRGVLAEGAEMTAVDHCVMMGPLLKSSRQAHWSQEDNFLDMVGYALNAWACHVEEEYRKTPEYLESLSRDASSL